MQVKGICDYRVVSLWGIGRFFLAKNGGTTDKE
jgi:hypothetical protein